MCIRYIETAPGGDLRPAARRNGDPVRRSPDCVHALGHAAARSLHRLDAQQPEFVFRGLRAKNVMPGTGSQPVEPANKGTAAAAAMTAMQNVTKQLSAIH